MSHSPLETDFCNILGGERERVCESIWGAVSICFQVSLLSHYVVFLFRLLFVVLSLLIYFTESVWTK